MKSGLYISLFMTCDDCYFIVFAPTPIWNFRSLYPTYRDLLSLYTFVSTNVSF